VINDRVFVTLERVDSRYPPWDEEEIWATPLGGETFRLAASPTFARGLSHGDIVHVAPFDDRWYIDSVVESGGHSTVRVILFKDHAHDQLLEIGRRHRCDVDHTEIQGLFAIDVPPSSSFQDLRRALSAGRSAGLWDIAEGNISAGHDT